MERFSSRSVRIGPKVYKDSKTREWGIKYYNAVQNIAFGRHCLPYMPTEPPASLSEEIVESDPLYVCKQCKDCFRFQSSFEDHNTRHSWILGLWCCSCYVTVCTHLSETSSANRKCCACTKKIRDKRTYLRTRGFNLSRKMGAVKVFYNQCQFVEHMKMHRLSSVNMSDLMLIPLPLDMSNSDWSSEFEIVCEALIERSFSLRIHIIEWLKMNNLQNTWWKLVNGRSNDNVINEIVNGYQGRQLFEFDKSAANAIYSSSNVTHNASKNSLDIEFIDNSIDKSTNSCSTDIISDKNVLEDEDNPYIPTDITFVDCGPASQCFEPEIPVNYANNEQVTAQEISNCHLVNTVKMNNKTTNETFKDRNSLEADIIHENITVKDGDNGSNKNLVIKQSLLNKNYVQRYKMIQPPVKKTVEINPSKLITKTDFSKIPDNSDRQTVKIGVQISAKNSAVSKTNSDHSERSLQTSKANSKTLAIQDSKNIASIISQLSPHLISNQKVVVIEQDSRNVIVHGENEMTTKENSSNSVADSSGTSSNTPTQNMYDSFLKNEDFTGKIIIRNGKKYLIKRARNITESSSNLSTARNTTRATKQQTSGYDISKLSLTSTNSNENIGIQLTGSLHNNISPLTPSSSSSELSSNSNCELHVTKTIMPKLQKVPPHLISISDTHSTIQKSKSETISLIQQENGDLYMDIKEVYRKITKESFLSVCDVIIKYRREMFDEFYQMNGMELKERLDHLHHVNQEMKQVFHFLSDTVFKEKLRAINTLQCILEECFHKYKQDVQDTKSDDVILNDWESTVDLVSYRKCQLCQRYKKPKSYIPGFSKLEKPNNEKLYCICYKQVCQWCVSYEGTISRFIAHQNFHKRCPPYICPDCNSKFNSITALETHTWTVCFHTLRKLIFTCKICEIDGFRDMESITRHFAIMHSKTKIGCEDCFRVFTTYSEYIQHCTETHPSKMEQDPIRLVICKLSNVILRCENYMSYLEKYPGVRKLAWFKCPFCNLITTDNKHVSTLLNTHLRENHIKPLSKMLSKETFIRIVGTEFFKANRKFANRFFKSHLFPKNTFTNEMPCTDDTVVPKIVNTRTISSEIFERGSQNTECTWSISTDEVVNESSQTMKKMDDKEKRELLPKIINVRSINDLKSLSKPKDAITKFSTETKMKSNSLFFIDITEDRKVDPLGQERTAMKLDDSKSNSQEATAKTKEFDKDNNELIMNASHTSESVNSPIVSTNKKVSNCTSTTSTDSHIKIVDFRKICKPDIAEMCDMQMRDENASYMASLPKPPPLARIPQYLFEPIEASEPENESAYGSKKSRSKRSLVRSVSDQSKVRIALGAGTQEEESIDYLCHLCNERINTSQFVVQAHFREKHSDEYRVALITPKLSRMSPDFINGGYKQFINNKKRKSDNALFVPKRKRRWTPKKHTEAKDANPPVGLCVEQETAEDGEGNFVCKKCGQRCTDMSDLREHIAANHRLKGRYLICLECGENFVVAPSLQMHLKAFHGIEDPINYMNQNPSYAPSFDGDLQTGERTTVANQCYVCMAVFEDKAAVDKHLRVHGMAFLNRKRIEARNALEKRANTEQDKQNIIKDDSKEAAKRDKLTETILEKINAAI